jgi:hypothetical protein
MQRCSFGVVFSTLDLEQMRRSQRLVTLRLSLEPPDSEPEPEPETQNTMKQMLHKLHNSLFQAAVRASLGSSPGWNAAAALLRQGKSQLKADQVHSVIMYLYHYCGTNTEYFACGISPLIISR